MLANGTIFDSTATGQTATFQLGKVIVGWQKGIPLVSSGGNITLFIPPTLAYGPSGSGPIPPNAILVFDIDLVGVN
jgi:FKBP-type peptidyl-prolyl cis-trans isomerase